MMMMMTVRFFFLLFDDDDYDDDDDHIYDDLQPLFPSFLIDLPDRPTDERTDIVK